MAAWWSGMRRAASRCRSWRAAMGAHMSDPWRSRPTARACVGREWARGGLGCVGGEQVQAMRHRHGGDVNPWPYRPTAHAWRRGQRWPRGSLGCGERRAGAGDGGRPWGLRSQLRGVLGRRHARGVGGSDGRVVVWDAASGKQVQAMEGGHGGRSVYSVAFSANGTRVRRGAGMGAWWSGMR